MAAAARPTRRRGGKRYAGRRYWESEVWREAEAGLVLVRYFESVGKVQFVQRYRTPDGELRPAKVVVLDVEALALSEAARALLAEVLADAR